MDDERETPPANAQDWSDEQWIEWLKATDAEEGGSDETRPSTRGARAVRSSGGQVLGDAMLGLASALYGPKEDKPAIIVESAEPDGDQPVEVHLDFDHPESSYVSLKAKTPPSTKAGE